MERYIAIYLRVSTEEQARHGYGLDAQQTQCQKYIELYYPNIDNIKIYKDDGYSAKNLHRPAMKQLLQDLEANKIETIICFKLDRMTRSVIDTYNLIDLIIKYDCSLVAVMDRLDITSANGRMLVGMLSIIAQWEREVIAERTVEAYKEIANKGKYPFCGCPFGWVKDKDKILSINEKEKSMIEYWVDNLEYGYKWEEIVLMTKDKFDISLRADSIKNYLLRKINYGEFEYRDDLYLNVFPPLMTKEEYDYIVKLVGNIGYEKQPSYQYMFNRIVYCEKCGKRVANTFTRRKQNGRTHYYYWCSNCNRRINQEELKEKAIPRIIKHCKEKEKDQIRQKNLRMLKDLEKKETDMFELYINNSIEQSVYLDFMEQLRHKKETCQSKLRSIDVKNLHEFYLMSEEEQFELIHSQVVKIVVDYETHEIKRIHFRKK